MHSTMFDDVKAFREKHNIPIQKSAGLLSAERLCQLTKHILEELEELDKATKGNNIVATADAIADSVWCILNIAVEMNIPFNQVWQAVVKANMNGKRRVTSIEESKRGDPFDVIKTESFVGPEAEIFAAIYQPKNFKSYVNR